MNLRDSFSEEFDYEGIADRTFCGISKDTRTGRIRNFLIFRYGLAMMVNAGIIHPCADEMICRYLKDAGEAFYLLELRREEINE